MAINNESDQNTPVPAISCSEWLDQRRSLYESNKDFRIIHEKNENGVTSHLVGSDDPRYKEVKECVFVENYQRCLELQQELDLLVKQMVHAGY